VLELAMKKPAPDQDAKIEAEIARLAGERSRLIDLRMKDLITVEEFEQRACKLNIAS
jgi:hypothetical protein